MRSDFIDSRRGMSKRVACMCERLCRDPRTCAPSDSVYAFVSVAFDLGRGGDWGGTRAKEKKREGGKEEERER